MLAVPAAGRGRVFGLAQADIIVQGAAILLAGGGRGSTSPPHSWLRAPEGLGTAAAVLLSGSLCRADRTGKAGQLRPT